MNKKLLLTFICASVLTLGAQEEAVSWNEKAMSALDQGKKIEDVVPLLQKGVEAGETDAMVNLAVFTVQGAGGLKKDDVEAARLLQLAADKGNPAAVFHLGTACLSGRGVAKDEKKGLELLHKASAAGVLMANYVLGHLAEQKKDYAEAIRWYEAAGPEHDECVNRLGILTYLGLGVNKSDSGALTLFLKAGYRGYAPAQNNAAFVLSHPFIGSPDWEKALEWYGKAAEQGNAAAQYNLATIWNGGAGDKYLDLAKSASYLKQSAKQGRIDAIYLLAMAYRDGAGIEKNPGKAFALCKIAAEANYSFACWQLADMYEKGIGTEKDPAQAEIWRKRSKLAPELNEDPDNLAAKPEEEEKD